MDNSKGDATQEPRAPILTLPQELRDKILEFALQTEEVTDYGEPRQFICPHEPCISRPTVNAITIREYQRQILRVLGICKQIKREGTEIFLNINVWKLRRGRLRTGIGYRPDLLRSDTLDMFGSFNYGGPNSMARRFRHFKLNIDLSPSNFMDIPPGHVDATGLPPSDPADLNMLLYHLITEENQCQLYQETINCFSGRSSIVFPSLRSIKIALRSHLHMKHEAGGPTKRCGVTINIEVLLEQLSKAEKSISVDQLLTLNEEAVKHLNFEHRRAMLVPLAKLRGVKVINVERKWVARYRQGAELSAKEVTKAFVQNARYGNIKEFLNNAGPNFENFLTTGLESLEVPLSDLVHIDEDVTGADEPLLVPIGAPKPLKGGRE